MAVADEVGAGCTGCAGLGCAVDEADCFARVILTHLLKSEELIHAEEPPLPLLALCDAESTEAALTATTAVSAAEDAAARGEVSASEAEGSEAKVDMERAPPLEDPLAGPKAEAAERAQLATRDPEVKMPEDMSPEEVVHVRLPACARISLSVDHLFSSPPPPSRLDSFVVTQCAF